MELHGRRGLVGGMWAPDANSQGFLTLEKSLDISGIRRAATMLEFVLFDPGSTQKSVLSVASIPIEHSFSGANAEMRGCMYMCRILNSLMEASNGTIQGLVCDSASTHQYIKKYIHGQHQTLPVSDIRELSWFRKIVFKPMPECEIPRMPMQIAYVDGEPIWAIPGVCTSTKVVKGSWSWHFVGKIKVGVIL